MHYLHGDVQIYAHVLLCDAIAIAYLDVLGVLMLGLLIRLEKGEASCDERGRPSAVLIICFSVGL
jgi:hypothetical protein